MEKELLIGDESCVSYGTDHLHAPRVAQDACSDSSPFEGASAPTYELLDNRPIDEEESTGDSGKEILSGSPDQLPHEECEGLHPQLTEWNILSVSEHDVKEALLRFAASKCCYRTAPAKGMNLQKLTPLNTYRYRLETFTETRETYWASGIYDGGFVDSPGVAPPPDPWEIMVDPPPLFTDCEMHLPIPHSYSVENCPNCKGRGTIMCQSCKGAGKKKCPACNGTGTNTQEDDSVCSWCAGTGDNRCFSCRSNGWLKCCRCTGSGILLFHNELTITWKNNVLERIADIDSGLPNHHFKDVAGKEILSDEHFTVFPIVDFPEPSINDYSRACIEQHKMQFASGSLHLILKQKQTIELVPVTKAECEWKRKLYSFYVFGNENQVYTEDYPGKCCCSLM